MKKSTEEKFSMIMEWKNSGLSQRAFCTAHNIAYHVFHYWYGVYRNKQKSTGTFLPIQIKETKLMDQTIVIKGMQGYEIHLPMLEASIPFIRQLLQG